MKIKFYIPHSCTEGLIKYKTNVVSRNKSHVTLTGKAIKYDIIIEFAWENKKCKTIRLSSLLSMVT